MISLARRLRKKEKKDGKGNIPGVFLVVGLWAIDFKRAIDRSYREKNYVMTSSHCSIWHLKIMRERSMLKLFCGGTVNVVNTECDMSSKPPRLISWKTK